MLIEVASSFELKRELKFLSDSVLGLKVMCSSSFFNPSSLGPNCASRPAIAAFVFANVVSFFLKYDRAGPVRIVDKTCISSTGSVTLAWSVCLSNWYTKSPKDSPGAPLYLGN